MPGSFLPPTQKHPSAYRSHLSDIKALFHPQIVRVVCVREQESVRKRERAIERDRDSGQEREHFFHPAVRIRLSPPVRDVPVHVQPEMAAVHTSFTQVQVQILM